MANDYGPRGNFSLYENNYKTKDNHPDFNGNIFIPFDLINIASEDENCIVEIKGTKCLKFKVSGWQNAPEDKKPLVSGSVELTPPKREKSSTQKANSTRRKLT